MTEPTAGSAKGFRLRQARVWLAVAAAVILVLGAVVAMVGGDEDVAVVADPTTSTSSTSAPERAVARSSTSTTTPPAAGSAGGAEDPVTSGTPTTVAPGRFVVTDVVDGDTIDVAGGLRVRLIGIDTPERGECGYSEATDVMRWLVGGREVALVPGARDDVDSYGRLLRYVEIDGRDVNLAMISAGRAIARYDSRDGYGRHDREDAYVRADATTPSANACGPPTTLAPSVPDGGGTDPRFGTCREATAAGLGPYRSGVDPEYGWYRDADGDGLVCE